MFRSTHLPWLTYSKPPHSKEDGVDATLSRGLRIQSHHKASMSVMHGIFLASAVCNSDLLLRIPSSGDNRYGASLYVRQCSDNDHQLLTPQSPLLLRMRDMLISPSNSRRPDTILLMMADTKAGLGSTTISSYLFTRHFTDDDRSASIAEETIKVL